MYHKELMQKENQNLIKRNFLFTNSIVIEKRKRINHFFTQTKKRRFKLVRMQIKCTNNVLKTLRKFNQLNRDFIIRKRIVV